MAKILISVKELGNLLKAKISPESLFKLLDDSGVDFFIKKPFGYKVLSDGDFPSNFHGLVLRFGKLCKGLVNPVVVENVRYIKINDCDFKKLSNLDFIEVVYFDEVIIGDFLDRSFRFDELRKRYVVVPASLNPPVGDEVSFYDGVEVSVGDLYILESNFPKIESAFFSNFLKDSLTVDNDFVTILNTCAYQYYKEDIDREYVKKDFIALLNLYACDAMKTDYVGRFPSILSRDGDRDGWGAAVDYKKEKEIMGYKKHESFSNKLAVINYLFHVYDNGLESGRDIKDLAIKYGIPDSVASIVAREICKKPPVKEVRK